MFARAPRCLPRCSKKEVEKKPPIVDEVSENAAFCESQLAAQADALKRNGPHIHTALQPGANFGHMCVWLDGVADFRHREPKCVCLQCKAMTATKNRLYIFHGVVNGLLTVYDGKGGSPS